MKIEKTANFDETRVFPNVLLDIYGRILKQVPNVLQEIWE